MPIVFDDAMRQVLKDRIQIRLAHLGVNQFVAAEKAGKNSHFIYDFMIDRKRAFKGDGLQRVASALECSVEYLIGRSASPGKAAEIQTVKPAKQRRTSHGKASKSDGRGKRRKWLRWF